MAKRAARSKADVFVNRVRGRMTFGADASAVITETFNTGMNVGRSDPMKWIILGAFISPNVQSANSPAISNEFNVRTQLCIGTQDAILDDDDMQVVSSGQKHYYGVTSGFEVWDPTINLNIRHPIPVFAQALTIMMIAANVAEVNNTEWYYEIQYLRASITQNEIVEYLAAFGQV